MLCRVFLCYCMQLMSCASFFVWSHMTKRKKRYQKLIFKQENSKHFNLIRTTVHYSVCSRHHKTIRSVGWDLLMQVNIASRAAILIMGNIIQYIIDDYEPPARPTKLQAHSVQDAFSFTRTQPSQTTLHCWHRWQNVDACFFFNPFKGDGREREVNGTLKL